MGSNVHGLSIFAGAACQKTSGETVSNAGSSM
jgi:hypothetical protein